MEPFPLVFSLPFSCFLLNIQADSHTYTVSFLRLKMHTFQCTLHYNTIQVWAFGFFAAVSTVIVAEINSLVITWVCIFSPCCLCDGFFFSNGTAGLQGRRGVNLWVCAPLPCVAFTLVCAPVIPRNVGAWLLPTASAAVLRVCGGVLATGSICRVYFYLEIPRQYRFGNCPPMHVGVFISWGTGELFALPRASSDHISFWGFLTQEFSGFILMEGAAFKGSCIYAVSLSSSGCSAQFWTVGLYRDLIPCWAPSFQLLCFARPSRILPPGRDSLPFFTASLCVAFSVYASVYNRISGGGWSLESQVSRLLEETPWTFIEVIPKWGSKMEIGSEVIICCAKPVFKIGLLMCETKILPLTKIEFECITQTGYPCCVKELSLSPMWGVWAVGYTLARGRSEQRKDNHCIILLASFQSSNPKTHHKTYCTR